MCEQIFFSERLMTLHESLMRNSPSPSVSAEDSCNQRTRRPSSPIDGDYRAGEMHPASTLRAANDGGESNCESDGGRDALDSRVPVEQNLNAWISDVYGVRLLCKWKTHHPVNVVTMTTPHLQHFTWKWKTDMCRVRESLEGHNPVEMQCGLLFFFWSRLRSPFSPQREVLSPASFWPLMDLKLIWLSTGCVGFLM